MLLRLALIAATVAAAAATIAPPTHAAASRLIGTVGPGFDITLSRGGKPVTRLAPGTYALVVRDRSHIHNFHLLGPGLSRVVTSVEFVGTKTITLRLKPGRYRYICDPHAFVMHGSFRVA